MARTKQTVPRSKYYWPLMILAIVVGLALGFGIVGLIVANSTGTVRIPRIVVMLPPILLAGLVQIIDSKVLAAAPDQVRKKDQALYTQMTGIDPTTGAQVAQPQPTGYDASTPFQGTPAQQTQGYAQASQAPAYGQAQVPQQGYAQQPYGQQQAYGQAQVPQQQVQPGQQPPSTYGY